MCVVPPSRALLCMEGGGFWDPSPNSATPRSGKLILALIHFSPLVSHTRVPHLQMRASISVAGLVHDSPPSQLPLMPPPAAYQPVLNLVKHC